MSEAARVLIQGNPNLESMPEEIRGVCHCQYYAVALMLVGYSLAICLKAMLIVRKGIAVYQAEEKKYYHHSLEKLADFVPDLNEKDEAILKGLSHFVRWAGRYPDPGFGKESHAEEILTLSEGYQISAKELFSVAARVMGYSRVALLDREQRVIWAGRRSRVEIDAGRMQHDALKQTSFARRAWPWWRRVRDRMSFVDRR